MIKRALLLLFLIFPLTLKPINTSEMKKAEIQKEGLVLLLAIAACYELDDVVDALLQQHANPNGFHQSHIETPLMAALDACVAESYGLKIIHKLLKYGADVNIQTQDGNNALMYLLSKQDIWCGNDRVRLGKCSCLACKEHTKSLIPAVELLIKEGVNIHHRNKSGQSAVDIARSNDCQEIVHLLQSMTKIIN